MQSCVRSIGRRGRRRHFSAIGVFKEQAGEQRVAMVPSVAQKLIKDGYTVKVESGAGAVSGFTDKQYQDAGCTVAPRDSVVTDSEVLFSVNAPPLEEFSRMRGKTAIAWVGRRLPDSKPTLEAAAAGGVQLMDLTAVPRITIAQKLDVLSSQAKCAGHRAVLEAANVYGRFFAPEVTAAGKYPPTNTMILGCGVAGLASIGTAKAMGSIVRAWDVRDVSDQVQSMGASWITVDFEESGAGEGGYAKESSPEFQQAQKDTFHKHLKEVDIVISTAAIPGRRSPVLIEDYMVKDMKPGSVIVDLAAAGGGNCTLTQAGKSIVTDNGVTIIGYTDLAGRMAMQSSAMYAQNLANLLGHISPKEKAAGFLSSIDAALAAGEDGDIVTRSIVCTKDGNELEMPPPPQPTPPKPKAVAAPVEKKEVSPFAQEMTNAAVVSGGCGLLLGMGAGVPGNLLGTFTLAGAAGYQAVWGVKHALHTPLMSVTNAISGATAFGGLMMLPASTGAPLALASVATAASAINVVGGFVITQRMLDLFKRPGDQDYSAVYAIPGAGLVAAPVLGLATVDSTGVVSQLLCIGAIGALSSMSTAQMGLKLGICGMAGGFATTLMGMPASSYPLAAGLLGSGALVGGAVGMKVEPIALPQTVAAFHSLVGLAAMITSIASFQAHPVAGANMHNIACVLGDYIGGVTLAGSLVAFGKLNGNMSSTPMSLPGKNMINLGMLAAQCGIGASFLTSGGIAPLWATAVLSNVMGYHLVNSVGGADMPVCITVLNSYSGWALVAEGFLLGSPLITVIGSLIGFSGGILTKIMCDAMNRDIMNVIFGGMNVAAKKKEGSEEVKEHTEINVDGAAALLAESKSVMIVPGYGMAVARCQNSVASIAKTLRDNGTEVRFGIHPVAGRMPGQMNVLLAEAGVPYDWVEEMDEVNPTMDDVDTCLIVGANDTTNSGAVEGGSDHPLAGMPVLEVWRAKKVIFMKRTMGAGYADVENPVFFKENTDMLLGNATDTTEVIAAKVKELVTSS